MKINIFNETDESIDNYIKVLKKLFKKEKHNKTMEIIFIKPEEIKKLNNDFRNINETTDVLSFPNDNQLDTSIGDVFINLDQALKQASSYNHSNIREVAFLAVHGYLHLLGFDHDTKEAENKMISRQKEILNKAKIERN